MESPLGPFRHLAYPAARAVSGILFACHGAQKLLGAFGGKPLSEQPALMIAAGLIELVGGLAIAIGLRAGVAAFIASGTMAVAYFMAHGLKSFWPIRNGGELAVVYCFLFLVIATEGSGGWSVDRLLAKRRA